jgi:plasmid maintenance system antidote protein VapI
VKGGAPAIIEKRRDHGQRICAGHTGEMLQEEFLADGLSQNRLARIIGISPRQLA